MVLEQRAHERVRFTKRQNRADRAAKPPVSRRNARAHSGVPQLRPRSVVLRPITFALLACAVLSFSACSTVNAPNPETSPAPAVTSSTSSATLFAPIVMSSATSDVLFGSREIAFSPNLSAFQRWQNVNTRFVTQRDAAKSSCDGSDPKTCPVQWWQGFITELEGLPLQERVALVNDTFNHATYVTAGKNWGNPGYWETPFEFLSRGGQCQDYAIAKYLALLIGRAGRPDAFCRGAGYRAQPRPRRHGGEGGRRGTGAR